MAEKKTVLIVDDDAFVRTTLRDLLAETGFELSDARDGEEALESIKKNQPDLVLLDLFMPRKSGLEVLAEIQRLTPSTRVLVISSLDADAIVESALERGAVGFIAKPFHPIEILAAVGEALK
ncbi:MAG: response regulator [Myxococcales bacterium]|jgi:two-component system chemotaxis response regulator CheY